MSLKNSLPIFVLTFKLEGGLNQITFLFWFRFVFWDGFSNFSCVWYPLFLSAVLYSILALVNSVSSQDKLEIRLLVIYGTCLIIDGGWLGFECMYRSVYLVFWKENIFLYLDWRIYIKNLSQWDLYQFWQTVLHPPICWLCLFWICQVLGHCLCVLWLAHRLYIILHC